MATIRESVEAGKYRDFASQLLDPRRLEPFGAAILSELRRAKIDINQPVEAGIGGVIRQLYEIGLRPGPQGHISVVTFKGVAQVIVGYKGFIHLGYQSGYLARVTAEVVLDGESFSLEQRETGPKLLHSIGVDRPEVSPENIKAAYCTWTSTDGHSNATLIQGRVIRELRNKSQQTSQWRTGNLLAMTLKTPVRAAAKWWRCSPEIALAITADEDQEMLSCADIDHQSNSAAAAEALAAAGMS